MKTSYVGIPYWQIPLDWDVERAFYWTFICQLLYNLVLSFIKASILFFLLRLGGQKSRVRTVIYVLNTFNFAMLVANFFGVMFQCRPVSYFWTQMHRSGTDAEAGKKRTGRCFDQPAFYVAQSALNIFTDILTLAVPFWIFLGLKMPKRLKRATLCVFGMGVV